MQMPTGPRASLVADVRKIAVLRANALGDLIFAQPALMALRAAYPAAEIVLLGQPWHRAFLAERPGPVNRVEVVPVYRGVYDAPDGIYDPDEHERFFARMQGERFDLAVQLHGGGRNSNPFLLRLGARVTCGLRTSDAPSLDRWAPYVYYQREVLRWLEVAALAGAPTVTTIPAVAVTAADLAESYGLIPPGRPPDRSPSRPPSRPLVVLHPGASDPERRWPAERFAQVGDALATQVGAQVIVTGGAGERELVAAVVRGMQASAVDAAGRLSLSGLAGLLSRAQLVVANDTGPLHLAAAVGARTVGIYWCFNFINAAPMTQAGHRPAIGWRVTCPVCGCDRARGGCEHHGSFVADVSVAEVVASSLELLASDEAPVRPDTGWGVDNARAQARSGAGTLGSPSPSWSA